MSKIVLDNKRIAKNSALLYMRMAVVMTLNLYVSRIVLKYLGIEDFGIYNVVGGVVSLFSYLNSALTAATQRFLNFEMGRNSIKTLNKVFSMSLNIHLILALFILIFAETIGLWFLNTQLVIPDSRIVAANWVYQFSIITAILQVSTIPYSAIIIAHEQMSVYAYISIGEVVLKLGLVLLLSVIPYDNLVEYALFMLIIILLSRFSYVLFAILKYAEAVYKRFWDLLLFKEMFNFIGWNFLGATAGVAMNQGVNILLNMFFGPIVNASRSIAVQVQQAFAQLATNFTTAVNPQIVKTYSSGAKERMTNLVIVSSKYAFLIMAITSMPFFVKMEFILGIWLGVIPDGVILYTKLILIYQLTICLTYSINMASQASGNIKLFQIVEALTLILILPIGWLQFNLGMMAESIFVTMIILSLIALGLRLLVLKRIINFNINEFTHKVILPLIRVSIMLFILYYVAGYICSKESTVWLGFIQMFLILLLACVVVYLFGMSREEKKIVRNILIKRLSK